MLNIPRPNEFNQLIVMPFDQPRLPRVALSTIWVGIPATGGTPIADCVETWAEAICLRYNDYYRVLGESEEARTHPIGGVPAQPGMDRRRIQWDANARAVLGSASELLRGIIPRVEGQEQAQVQGIIQRIEGLLANQ
ncbi:MAG: hypothetical protein K1X67_17570 [Fimbriimonadaceae bacterium]|nr:hypothetical protein [Fimbriimonadaceae bacterium]